MPEILTVCRVHFGQILLLQFAQNIRQENENVIQER